MHFNPQAFMEATIQGALDTRRVPCPQGDFPGVIEKIEPKSGENKQGERVGQTWAALEVTYKLEHPEITSVTGLPFALSRQCVMIDITDEGGMDRSKGKNIRVGKLREACNENDAGKPFA